MTRYEKAAATAKTNREKREARKQRERLERETIKGTMLSVLSDENATSAEKVEAAQILSRLNDGR